MRRTSWILSLSALVVGGSAAAQQPITCAAIERFVCNVGIGCQAGETGTTWVNIYPRSKEYERCDAKGCERYPAAFSTAGVFTTVELAGRGAFVPIPMKAPRHSDLMAPWVPT